MSNILDDLVGRPLPDRPRGRHVNGVRRAPHRNGYWLPILELQDARQFFSRLINMKRLQPIPAVTKDGASKAKIWRSFDGYFHSLWATAVRGFRLVRFGYSQGES